MRIVLIIRLFAVGILCAVSVNCSRRGEQQYIHQFITTATFIDGQLMTFVEFRRQDDSGPADGHVVALDNESAMEWRGEIDSIIFDKIWASATHLSSWRQKVSQTADTERMRFISVSGGGEGSVEFVIYLPESEWCKVESPLNTASKVMQEEISKLQQTKPRKIPPSSLGVLKQCVMRTIRVIGGSPSK